MIPAEAVEAARRVAFERYGARPDAAYLRTILEAATPHMLADRQCSSINQGRRCLLLPGHEPIPEFVKFFDGHIYPTHDA